MDFKSFSVALCILSCSPRIENKCGGYPDRKLMRCHSSLRSERVRGSEKGARESIGLTLKVNTIVQQHYVCLSVYSSRHHFFSV